MPFSRGPIIAGRVELVADMSTGAREASTFLSNDIRRARSRRIREQLSSAIPAPTNTRS